MDNSIRLEFEKTLTSLTYLPFGEKTYETQVKGKIDYSKSFTIFFPERIDDIGASFIQGFFKDIVKESGGVDNFFEKAKIVVANEDLLEKINNNIILIGGDDLD